MEQKGPVTRDNNAEQLKERAYQENLDLITKLAEQKNVAEIAQKIGLSEVLVDLSLKCVGDGRRKGTIKVAGADEQVTHFSHMARVAYIVKYYFPEDEISRSLAMLHDTKEEAQPGMEERYKESDMAGQIDLLTEDGVSEDEIEAVRAQIPEEFDPQYVAKYRKYVDKLHKNWTEIRAVELCDRLDGSSSFEYLSAPKYQDRLRLKALETFGRIWATVSIDSGEVVDRIKKNCRAWFSKFEITEKEVEDAAKMFLFAK